VGLLYIYFANINSVFKSNSMVRAEQHLTGADIVVSKREWKTSLLKHSCTWENNIKMGFKERGSEGMDYSSVSEYEPLAAVL
jgi:hypothetical protein